MNIINFFIIEIIFNLNQKCNFFFIFFLFKYIALFFIKKQNNYFFLFHITFYIKN